MGLLLSGCRRLWVFLLFADLRCYMFLCLLDWFSSVVLCYGFS